MRAVVTDGLSKSFGSSVAITDVNLEVYESEIFGLLGPNGAGKSTTLNLLFDFLRPTSGAASVLGHDPWEDSREIRELTGLVPEGYSLYDRLTATEHIDLAIGLKGTDDSPISILERVGLEGEASRKVGTFSKGMRQRLALAIALVGEPKLLVMDEPSTGLDPNGVRKLREIIRQESDRGATVVLSSHDMTEIEAVCDRVGIMNDGELLTEDTIENLRDRADEDESIVVSVDTVPASKDVSALRNIDSVVAVSVEGTTVRVDYSAPETKMKVLSELEATGVTVRDIDVKNVSVEDVFTDFITSGERDEEAN